MTSRLYPRNSESLEKILPELVNIMEKGEENRLYAFACLEDLSQTSVNAARTESAGCQSDRGLVLRIFTGDCNFEYALNDFSRRSLIKAAIRLRKRALVHCKKNNSVLNFRPLSWSEEISRGLVPQIASCLSPDAGPDTCVHFSSEINTGYELNFNIDAMAKKAALLRDEIIKRSENYPPAAGCLLRQKIKSRIFCDRSKNMSQTLVTSLLYLHAFSRKGIMARRIIGGLGGFEIAENMLENEINLLCALPQRLDEAGYIKPGRYKIITGPDVTGVIAHEAFGHTQEGDTCRLGRSAAPFLKKNKIKIGNDQAVIVNNPALFSMGKYSYGQNGTHFFDDEGELARRQIILDRGYLSSPMNDLISSCRGDINGISPRTSNGKRESWRRPLLPRQTNTYFTAGDKTLDELISMTENGFIAEFAHGGMEDPKGMGLTAGTEYLEEIREGKRTGRLFLGPQGGHIELSDPVPLLLSSIIAKSSVDPERINEDHPYNKWGGCGKYHKELVEAGSGGPWILWHSIKCG